MQRYTDAKRADSDAQVAGHISLSKVKYKLSAAKKKKLLATPARFVLSYDFLNEVGLNTTGKSRRDFNPSIAGLKSLTVDKTFGEVLAGGYESIANCRGVGPLSMALVLDLCTMFDLVLVGVPKAKLKKKPDKAEIQALARSFMED